MIINSLRAKLLLLVGVCIVPILLVGAVAYLELRDSQLRAETIRVQNDALKTLAREASMSSQRGRMYLSKAFAANHVSQREDLSKMRSALQGTMIDFDIFIKALEWGPNSTAFREISGGLTYAQWVRRGWNYRVPAFRPPKNIKQIAGVADLYFGAFSNHSMLAVEHLEKSIRAELNSKPEVAERFRREAFIRLGKAERFESLIWDSLKQMVRLVELNADAAWKEVELEQTQTIQYLLGLGAVCLGMSALLLWIVWRRIIIRPITSLVTAVDQIGAGSLDVRMSQRPNDELGHLMAQINSMAQNLQDTTVSWEFVDNIIQSMADTLVVVMRDDTIHLVNNAACELLNYQADELVGQPVQLIIEAYEDGSFLAKGDREYLVKDGSISNRERIYITRDGKRIPVLFSASEMRSGKGIDLGLVCVAQDITERKKLQDHLQRARDEALEAARLKSDFLANISHELRTPMNGIIGMTDLTLETKLDDEQRENLEIVSESARSLLTIVNDVLDFAKIESGKLDLEDCEFSIRDVLKGILRVLNVQAEKKNQQLIVEIDEQLPQKLIGDPSRLRQVIINLLGNAIKFTDEYGVISLLAFGDQESLDRFGVHIVVSDTGIGIPQHKQDLIFEAFAQADASTTRQFGGTGLGLSISKSLVELMEGKLWVESKPGIGTAFHICVPLSKPQEEDQQPVQREEREDMLEILPAQILLAEDNPVNRKLAVRLLEKDGHSVKTAANGVEVLEQLEVHIFDLILMDIQMPEMGGIEATQRIRESSKDYSSIPIVALTAHAIKGDREKFIDSGMNDYVSKPINRSELRDVIQRVMNGASAKHQIAG